MTPRLPGSRACPRRQSAALRVVLALCAGQLSCSPAATPGPEWPSQPSPSYPDPASPENQTRTTPAKAAPLDETAAPVDESAPTSALAKSYKGAKAIKTMRGKATYYADSLAGNHTANGEIYDPAKLTAAHKKLPFGTVVRVTRLDNEAVTYVRINDRGPFGSADRIIDLSKAAAKELDMLRAGVVKVTVEVLEKPNN